MYYNYTYCTITITIVLFAEDNFSIVLQLRTLIWKPNLYYCTVSESAKLGYYCTIVLWTVCTVWTKIQHVISKNASMQNESPTLKLFYFHTPTPKSCCVSCITLLYISCIIHHYMKLYNYITGVQKLFKLVVIDWLALLSLELLMQLDQLALLPFELLLQLNNYHAS